MPAKTKIEKSQASLTFFSEDFVKAAKENEPNSNQLSEFQKEASQIASQTIAEIDWAFTGGPNILDENIDFVQRLADHWRCPIKEASASLKEMRPGSYFLFENRGWIRTSTNEFQEIGTYVNRLEKATIRVQTELSQKSRVFKTIEKWNFFQRLIFLFLGKKTFNE